MDYLHNPELRKDWISPPIHLESYFSEYSSLFRQDPVLLSSQPTKNIHKSLLESEPEDLDHDTLNEIKELTDPRHLDMPNSLPPMVQNIDTYMASKAKSSSSSAVHGMPLDPLTEFPKFNRREIPKEGVATLKTLECQSKFLSKAKISEKQRRARMARHSNNNWFEARPHRPERLSESMIEQEILVVARIYRPIKPLPGQTAANLNMLRYHQEILLLGSNKLSELRDHIKCVADEMVPGDFSTKPETAAILGSKEEKKTKNIYKSGFFYIEGCFYNDMRYPDCIDYSETIRNWAESGRRNIGPFTTAKMEDTCIKDLTMRIGMPYVYVHQGDHEHLVSFMEARLFSKDDPQRTAKYPFERSVGMKHSKFCMVCSMSIAKWVTKDNERVPEDPYFFCQECFIDYNYTHDGFKIGVFKAFPFVDVNAL